MKPFELGLNILLNEYRSVMVFVDITSWMAKWSRRLCNDRLYIAAFDDILGYKLKTITLIS
jgi:hypothetical protein